MKNKQVVKGNDNNVFNNQGDGDQIVHVRADQVPIVDRTRSEPLPVFGRPFKIKWLLISSIITFAADLLTVIFGFKQLFTGSFVYYLFIGLCLLFMLTFGLYTVFRSGALLRLRGKNIVARDGILKEEVYSFSPCPNCGGKLFLASDKQLGTVLRCSIYPHLPDHRFAFSTKIFDESAYPDK